MKNANPHQHVSFNVTVGMFPQTPEQTVFSVANVVFLLTVIHQPDLMDPESAIHHKAITTQPSPLRRGKMKRMGGSDLSL